MPAKCLKGHGIRLRYMNLALSLKRKMGRMGRMGVKFFEPPSSSFQGGRHISHQASLLPEERGCNRTQCCFSKIIPSFFTIKEGSTSHLGLLPSGKKRKTALRCSEPLRYKVGGASKPCAILRAGTAWGIVVYSLLLIVHS